MNFIPSAPDCGTHASEGTHCKRNWSHMRACRLYRPTYEASGASMCGEDASKTPPLSSRTYPPSPAVETPIPSYLSRAAGSDRSHPLNRILWALQEFFCFRWSLAGCKFGISGLIALPPSVELAGQFHFVSMGVFDSQRVDFEIVFRDIPYIVFKVSPPSFR